MFLIINKINYHSIKGSSDGLIEGTSVSSSDSSHSAKLLQSPSPEVLGTYGALILYFTRADQSNSLKNLWFLISFTPPFKFPF